MNFIFKEFEKLISILHTHTHCGVTLNEHSVNMFEEEALTTCLVSFHACLQILHQAMAA